MDAAKREALEADGWRIGTAQEFLEEETPMSEAPTPEAAEPDGVGDPEIEPVLPEPDDETTSDDVVDTLDALLEEVEEHGLSEIVVQNGGTIYTALGLARAVAQLIGFGGGGLKLPSGHTFRLVKSCDACQNASRMFTRAGLESKFCVRCANDLAEKAWAIVGDPHVRPPTR